MYLQPGTAGAVYWAVVAAALFTAVIVMYKGVAGPDERTSPIEDSKEDQVLRQAA